MRKIFKIDISFWVDIDVQDLLISDIGKSAKIIAALNRDSGKTFFPSFETGARMQLDDDNPQVEIVKIPKYVTVGDDVSIITSGNEIRLGLEFNEAENIGAELLNNMGIVVMKCFEEVLATTVNNVKLTITYVPKVVLNQDQLNNFTMTTIMDAPDEITNFNLQYQQIKSVGELGDVSIEKQISTALNSETGEKSVIDVDIYFPVNPPIDSMKWLEICINNFLS